jgi:hypothetical protein
MEPRSSPVPAANFEGEVEFVLQFLAPLAHQGDRGQHESPAHESAQDVLLENEPGLDRLAEPDLIRQDGPPPHLPQYAQAGLDLELVTLEVAHGGRPRRVLESQVGESAPPAAEETRVWSPRRARTLRTHRGTD